MSFKKHLIHYFNHHVSLSSHHIHTAYNVSARRQISIIFLMFMQKCSITSKINVIRKCPLRRVLGGQQKRITLKKEKTHSKTFPFKRMLSSNLLKRQNHKQNWGKRDGWTDTCGIWNSTLDLRNIFTSNSSASSLVI